jgi:hypothetical protein
MITKEQTQAFLPEQPMYSGGWQWPTDRQHLALHHLFEAFTALETALGALDDLKELPEQYRLGLLCKIELTTALLAKTAATREAARADL